MAATQIGGCTIPVRRMPCSARHSECFSFLDPRNDRFVRGAPPLVQCRGHHFICWHYVSTNSAFVPGTATYLDGARLAGRHENFEEYGVLNGLDLFNGSVSPLCIVNGRPGTLDKRLTLLAVAVPNYAQPKWSRHVCRPGHVSCEILNMSSHWRFGCGTPVRLDVAVLAVRGPGSYIEDRTY